MMEFAPSSVQLNGDDHRTSMKLSHGQRTNESYLRYVLEGKEVGKDRPK